MYIILVITILGGIFLYSREQQSRKIKQELQKELEMTGEEKTAFSVFMDQWGLPIGVGGITFCDAIYSISLIDDNVLKAVDFSLAANLSSFGDLSQFITANYNGGSGLEGLLARLEGYTAEQVTSAHLVSQGHVVEFPETSNQAGYDLLVNGHPFQVKDTLAPELINEHLEKYPDIPVIINSEMGAHFADHPDVIVDPDLSHDQIATAVHYTIDGISLLDSAAIHIPFITLALSSIKEGSLLLDEKTDFKTAGKHVLYDTTSVGIGGAAGAKIGILVGSAAGPAGAGFGLVLGGVGGALGGKFLAQKIKHSGLEKKRESYNRAVTQVRMIMPAVIDQKKQLVTTKMDKALKALKVPWWHSFWAIREGYIAEELEDKYRQVIKMLDELENHLQSLPPVQAGEEACKTASEGGLYDPILKRAFDKVKQAQAELLKEKRKLGLA